LIFKSLTTRVIVISISLLAFGISAFAYLNLKREQRQLIDSARESSRLLLNAVESSIYNSMRIGNTADVQTILEMVGNSHKLLAVRIFHPHGVILRSSNPLEVGKTARPDDYNLFISNRMEGIYNVAGEGDVLKMLKPIYNDEPCHACHGHKARIIGILNINYSLAETKQRMVDATKLFFFSTFAIIVFLSVTISVIMFRFVRKPLDMIAENMAKVEQGDLSVRMKPASQDEVGKLIASFDSMVDRLDVAKQELERFHFQQMERADRLASVGEMAAGIAHEIKNPLTGIAAAITIIKDDFTSEDPRREIVNEVLAQINRLDKTVNDLLYFGKPSQPELAYADINTILKKTLMFAGQHRGGINIEKRLELAENLPPVYVDPKQIQQVLLNLILNAVQAMQDGGTLTITSSAPVVEGDKWVRVTVEDTGPGIPQQILEKIFAPFFTTKAQGTGLGLAICQKLINQHNGTISVRSGDTKGTVFTVDLPAAELGEAIAQNDNSENDERA
jgi:signal transduction histidine kinase